MHRTLPYLLTLRGIWKGLILVFLLIGAFAGYLLFTPGGTAHLTFIDNVIQGLCESVGLLLALPLFVSGRKGPAAAGVPAHRDERSQRWVPRLLSLALVSYVIGQLLWTYNENILQLQVLFPTWADAGYLASYPCVLGAFLLLPSRRLSATTRTRIVLDSLMLITGITTFGWYFLLGPTILQGGGTLLIQLVSTAYPLATLVLVCCLFLLALRSNDPVMRPVVLVLACALIVITLTDSIYGYQELHGTYVTGTLLDLGWPLGYLLMGLGARAFRLVPVIEHRLLEQAPVADASMHEHAQTGALPLWQALLPYAFLPAIGVLLLATRSVLEDSALKPGVYVGGAILISLVVLRQILAIREAALLHQDIQRTNHALGAANVRLEALSTTDPLTELPNHRALLDGLDKEIERARRYGHPVSVLFFDGDHFKRVNDTYGHSIGDAVLCELGSRVRSLLRGGDTLGRYGGEEFMVLLPETDASQACQIAERMRSAVASHSLALGLVPGGIPVTISMGVATFPIDGQTAGEVRDKADQAMYWAKRLGRNQIRTALEAARASQDAALAATIHQLERGDEGAGERLSVEHSVRANQLSTIQSLMELLEVRDQGISAHSYQVSDLAAAIAQDRGLDHESVFAVSTAALLHDIGKIALPDLLLQKAGTLSSREWELITQHPEFGAQILEVSPYLHHLMPAVHHHHENWDGTGYPDALAGETIPLAARIIRVAEASAAMMSTRAYQAERSSALVRYELQRCAGAQFDPDVVQVALRVLARTEEEVVAGREGHLVS